jgi:hypothetical protein
MANNWTVTLDDGRTWFVGAFSIFGEPKHYPSAPKSPQGGEIIIPTCQLEGLTAQQIGDSVLSLVPMARTCHAEHVAIAYIASEQEYQRRAPGDCLETMVFNDLPLLEEHQGDEYAKPEIFNEAIAFLREMKARYEASRLRKIFKTHPARKVVSRDYDKLFMRVGRRDGFHCGACQTTTNLQIDHVKSVSAGGTSEIENLQLLCGSCNAKKSDKAIDYRGAAA